MRDPFGYEFLIRQVVVPEEGSMNVVTSEMHLLDSKGWEVLSCVPAANDSWIWYITARRAKDD